MRSPYFNVNKDLAAKADKQLSLALFRKMCLVRYFEAGIIDAIDTKKITYPVYLSSGQESLAAALSLKVRDYMIFAQHRAHDVYLTFGGDPVKLRDELLGLSSGTSQGKAGSNCIQYFDRGISMFGHHGLIGENVPQAVGAALGSGRNTLCLVGDGAAEEDYVMASLGFAATHSLPVLFVCVDNDLSILTKTAQRRNWSISSMASSLGIPSVDLSDDPWTILDNLDRMTLKLPAFINCYVCRAFWHVGVGIDGAPEWNRFSMVKECLSLNGYTKEIDLIESDIKQDMEKLWETKLSLKQSGR